MILHWLDQQTCSSWTFASLLLYFWTRLYLGALFSAAGHWSIQRSNKQLGVTVDSSVDLVFCFWRIHKGNFLIVALALMVTSKIANTIKITPKMSDFPLLGGLTYSNSHYPFFFCSLIWADYIHKSCFYFSGVKKMLLLRPISWSYCVAT